MGGEASTCACIFMGDCGFAKVYSTKGGRGGGERLCVCKKEVGRSDQWGETGGLGFWRYGGGGRRFRFKSAGVRIGPTNRLLS